MHVTVDARMIESSGIGRVIRNILQRMIPLKPDWEFSLIGSKKQIGNYAFSQAGNVTVIDCQCPIYSIKEQFVMPGLIPKDTDVYWVPHYNIPVFYSGKMVVTVHDLAHLALPEINKGLLKRIYAKTMFRAVCRKASQIACVSKFTISELQKYVPSVDMSKVNLVYNGIDESWYHIPSGPKLHDKPYLIYVGNIKPHKNLRFLIKAYQQVADRVPYDLILVGKKDGFLNGDNNIDSLIKGWEKRIFFTGWVSDEELQQYVAQSEAMVFPSLYEGFGLPPLEAMAAGKKVLASDIPVMREVCGEQASYFEPNNVDALSKCLQEIDQFNVAVNKLNQQSRKFSWNSTASKMVEIFLTKS